MNLSRLSRAVAAVAVAACWTGCGQPGPPRPPSRNIALAPQQFTATREGERINLSWTVPAQTTDGARLRGPVRFYECVWPADLADTPPPPTAPCPSLRPLLGPAAVPQQPLTAQQSLTALRTPMTAGTSLAFVAMATANPNAELSAWSVPVRVSLLQAPPPPSNITAKLSREGVVLSWNVGTPARQAIRVYRRISTPAPTTPAAAPKSEVTPEAPSKAVATAQAPNKAKAPAAKPGIPTIFGTRERRTVSAPTAAPAPEALADLPPDQTSYVDRNVQWGASYVYTLRSVVGTGPAEAESADSAPASAVVKNVFPPPVPSGVEALATPGTPAAVDLSWQPVDSTDLAGYNVYARSVSAGSNAAPGAEWQKRNTTLVLTPVFHDTPVAPGRFEYAVTSVNPNGFESAKSAPVTVMVAQQ